MTLVMYLSEKANSSSRLRRIKIHVETNVYAEYVCYIQTNVYLPIFSGNEMYLTK